MLFRNQHTVQPADVRPGHETVSAALRQENRFGALTAGTAPSRTPAAPGLAVILLFVLVITLPFLNQAFHIDDAIFWDFAKLNLESPLQQHLSGYNLMGEAFTEWRDTHPPVDSLYLSMIMRLAGSDAELPLHVGFVIFPLLAGVSMFYLARRFTTSPVAAALLLLATPAVMVMSHTLMADVPLMATWLAATALYIYGVDRDSTRLLVLSGFAVAVAIFTGYQALALLLFLPAYPALLGRLSLKNTMPLAIPVAAFGLFVIDNVVQYGELPRFSHARGTSLDPSHLLDRIEGMLLHVGGTSIFPLSMAAIFSLRRRRYLLLPAIVGAAAALGLYQYRSGQLLAAPAVIYVILMSAALTLLAALVMESCFQLAGAVRRRHVDIDFLFLTFWVLVMMVSTIAALPHATAKYTLTFAAPIVLIAFREMEKGLASAKAVRALAVATIVLTFLTGAAVSAADYVLAGSYRDFVASVPERYQTDGTVWFVGEWGFRHYMEARGYRYLTSDDESPDEGDLIITPSVADWPLAPSVAGRMELVETVKTGWRLPLRVMSFEAGAGFYGTYWGILPYSVAEVPVETFEVFRVGSPAEPTAGAGRS